MATTAAPTAVRDPLAHEGPGPLLGRIPEALAQYMTARHPGSSVANGAGLAARYSDGEEFLQAVVAAVHPDHAAAAAASPAAAAAAAGGGSTEDGGTDAENPPSRGATLGLTCDGCGVAAPEGRPFAACGGCRRAAFCGRECLKRSWPAHKVVCRPETLRADVPAEREAAAAVKRAAVAQLLPHLAAQLSLAATAWHQRHGRGVVVAWMASWANLASPARARDCQLYAFYVPSPDLKRRAALPAVAAALSALGGEKRLRDVDPDEALVAAFLDDDGWSVTMKLGLTPPRADCERALAISSDDVRGFDVLALDLNKEDGAAGWPAALFAF